jgi:hypothetical protein
MSKMGMYHALFYLPSSIFLPEKSAFTIEVKERSFEIIIEDRFWATGITDFSEEILGSPIRYKKNDFKFSKNAMGIVESGEVSFVIDFPNNVFRESYRVPYTAIVIRFETTKNPKNFEYVYEAYNYFLLSYQIISQDNFALTQKELFTNNILQFEYFYEYNQDELSLDKQQRQALTYPRPFKLMTATVSEYRMKERFSPEFPELNKNELEKYFVSKAKNEYVLETLLNAQRQSSLYKNYKYSLLDCFFIIEYVIFQYVQDKKLEKGISMNKLKDYSQRVGISYMINVELPMLVEDYNDDVKSLVIELDKVRKIRNDVVHQAKTVSMEQATIALTATRKLLQYFKIPKY